MTDYSTARTIALRFLDYAPRTSAEVRRRLMKEGFEEGIIEALLADLERAGLLDDAQFSRDWVAERSRRKGLGRDRLAAELRRKGVDQEQIDRALGALDEKAEFEAALALARRRISLAPSFDSTARRRLAACLQRRGHNWEIIEKVFATLFSKSGE